MFRLNEIETSPGPFCMSFGYDLRPLMDSIKAIGLINEPFVIQGRDGQIRPVIGFRRIEALKALGVKTVTCKDLSETDLSEFDCLVLGLLDNLATRKFNEVEKGMILRRLVKYVARDQVLKYYMPLLGLPPRENTLEVYFALEDLDLEIKESLIREQVSLKAAEALLHMESEAALGLCRWIKELRLSFNYQLQFIDYIMDISSMEDKTVTEVLGTLGKMLEDKEINRPQRVKRLFKELRRRRYPSLYRAEQEFKSKIKRLSLPEDVRIKHPPNFEGPKFLMEIWFHDGQDLRRKLNQLHSTQGIEGIIGP